MFVMGLSDDVGKLLDLVLQLGLDLLGLVVLLLFGFQAALNSVDLLLSDSQVMVLVGQGLVFGFDFILKLGDLVRSDLELPLELSHFILGFNQILGVQVPVGSDSLIEVLLLFQLAFEFDVFLFQFGDKILLKLDFFNHLHEIGVGLACFMGELVPLFLKLLD